jgi:hypothetical protein
MSANIVVRSILSRNIDRAGLLLQGNQLLTIVDNSFSKPKASVPIRITVNGKPFEYNATVPRVTEVKTDRTSRICIATIQFLQPIVDTPFNLSPSPSNLQGSTVYFRDARGDETWLDGRVSRVDDQVFRISTTRDFSAETYMVVGSPVAVREGGFEKIIGMIVSAGADALIAVRSEKLGQLLYYPQERGTTAWNLAFLRQNTIQALLHDLELRERDGLADAQCQQVQAALETLANTERTKATSAGFWEDAIRTDLEDFAQTFIRWNSHEGPQAPRLRGVTLIELRLKRRRIARQFSTYQGILSVELDNNAFEGVYATLGQVANSNPGLFVNLQQALLEYRRRTGIAI